MTHFLLRTDGGFNFVEIKLEAGEILRDFTLVPKPNTLKTFRTLHSYRSTGDDEKFPGLSVTGTTIPIPTICSESFSILSIYFYLLSKQYCNMTEFS